METLRERVESFTGQLKYTKGALVVAWFDPRGDPPRNSRKRARDDYGNLVLENCRSGRSFQRHRFYGDEEGVFFG